MSGETLCVRHNAYLETQCLCGDNVSLETKYVCMETQFVTGETQCMIGCTMYVWRHHVRHTQCVSGHDVCLETACVTGDIIWTQCVSGGTMCVWWKHVSPEIVRHNVYLKSQCVSGGHNVLSTMSVPQSRRVPGKLYKPRGLNTKHTIPQGFNTKCNNIQHQMHMIQTLSFDIPSPKPKHFKHQNQVHLTPAIYLV